MAGIADKVFSLIEPAVEAQGVSLWDVKFLKEGASYYLRVFIDSEQGIGIDECTNVSHAIDPILDEADPIDKSYYLEVCSPGIERELSRDEHFAAFTGEKIKLRLFKAVDGTKSFGGVLKAFENGVITVLCDDGTERSFERASVSKVNLDDFEQ